MRRHATTTALALAACVGWVAASLAALKVIRFGAECQECKWRAVE